MHYCIPDLLINDNKIVEVKPNFRIKYDKEKLDATRNYCNTHNLIFEIWNEDIVGKNAKSLS